MYKNEVLLKGLIVNLYMPQARPLRVIATISTGINHPKVFAVDGIAEKIMKNYAEGDVITIRGNIQSTFKPKVGRGTTIFVDSILDNDTIKEDYYNHFLAVGDAIHIRHNVPNEICCVTVKTHTNSHTSYIPISFYQPHKEMFARNIDVPCTIAITGSVQTVKKTRFNGRHKYYENYVADFPRQTEKNKT